MIKTLHRTLKLEKEKFKIPKSVQRAIPIQRIWPDGIFQSGRLFSKSFRFTDINYSIASKEDKTEMFLDYSELLNALDSGASAKLTINNRRINKAEFEQSILIPMKEDGLDEYRKEYNEMLLSKISDTNNSILRERYLTISVHKKNIDEARTYFARVGTDITTHLAKLSSMGEELDAGERLKIFRDFFKEDVSATAEFDFKEAVKRGHDFKDWFAPDSMEFLQDHFKIDGRYGRVLYMQDYATYVRDSMVSELCDLSRNLMLSIDILPVPTDEAVIEIQNKLLGVETNVTNWQRRQNENNNFSATIPYEMELQRTERGLNGMDIVKVSIMGICGMMLGFILKETRPEFAALVTMMTGFLILGLAAGKVSYLFETMNRLRESFPIDSSYLTVLVKIIGITYIGQFSSAICKDAGYQMIGTQIDLFCKLSVMVLSMPVLLAILDTISEFMI